MAGCYPNRTSDIIIKDEEGKESCVISSGLTSDDGGVFLNDSAREVLLSCNGTTDIGGLVDMFEKKYTGSTRNEIQQGVDMTVDQLVEFGLIELRDKPGPSRNVAVKKCTLSLDLVYLEVTRACNLRCIHCYNEAGLKREKEMKTDEILGIIKALSEIGVIDVVITGGEPFMRKDIFEIIRAIRSKDMRFSVFTNGVMLDKAFVGMLADCGPRFVAVSLDGAVKPTHEKIRGEGTFENTVNAIKLLIAAGIKVRVNHTLTAESVPELKNFMGLMDALGVNDVYFDRFDSLGRGKEHAGMVIPVEKGHEIKSLLDSFGAGKYTGLKNYSPGIKVIAADDKNLCGVGINSCYIKANGEVSFCPVMSGSDFTVGSLLENRIQELWTADKWDALRKATPDTIPECRDCPGKNICLGGCKAKAYNEYGVFSRPDPWSCYQIKGMIEKSGKVTSKEK